MITRAAPSGAALSFSFHSLPYYLTPYRSINTVLVVSFHVTSELKFSEMNRNGTSVLPDTTVAGASSVVALPPTVACDEFTVSRIVSPSRSIVIRRVAES